MAPRARDARDSNAAGDGLFAAGRVAFMTVDHGAVPNLRAAAAAGRLRLGFVSIPRRAGAEPATVLYASGYAAPANLLRRKAAVELAADLTDSVADATRGAVRQSDVVGRLGGDEFAVLMPETEGPVAHAAATRLASSIRTVFKGTPSVTASIGVVSMLGAAAGPDALLQRADAAMYEAKRAGKDRVVQVTL